MKCSEIHRFIFKKWKIELKYTETFKFLKIISNFNLVATIPENKAIFNKTENITLHFYYILKKYFIQ